MKQALIILLGLMTASVAHADGFNCLTSEGDLKVKIYNHTQPEMGTRNVAIMVLSDPQVAEGRQTIASFTSDNQTLDNAGATYSARVDLRFTESERKGEYLLGTRLGFIKDIQVNVDFSYGQPVSEGTLLPAELIVVKRDGEEVYRELVCSRYLKH